MIKNKLKSVESIPNFPKLEEELLERWYKSGVVKKYLEKNSKSNKYFSFLDGPITANNPMGIHHGWGRTYKDLWQRFFNMLGYRQRFQNGFDCQGLWVEVEVEKELGFKSKKEIEIYGIAKFVQKCKDRVKKYSKIQTEQSKRLGYFMDWENSYFTMSDENNYMIWHFLKVCKENGWLYKGKDSVPWCPRCETAISQHEMLTEDYKEVAHESIFLELPIVGKKHEFLLVWTTTPWTIPANIAVAVDNELDYVLVKGDNGDKFWLAKGAVKQTFKQGHKGIVKTVKGKELVGLRYFAPFDHLPAVKKIARHPKFHTVIASDQRILQISTDEGTGLVHTAVSAGSEDFKLGKKLGLPMVPVIADNADYLEGLGFLTGKNAKKNPRLILDYLISEDKKEGQDWVFKIHKYKHRYPACWRCKEELVWKVTDEWYISMDSGKPSLRERMKKVTKKINWIPEFGLDRELDWLNNMHDWLISKKNRYWGLCLPIWECTNCNHFEVIGSKEELKKKAIEGWDKLSGKSPHKPQIDAVKIKCEKCGTLISRIEPVGNPWLDAGIVSFSTISADNKGRPLYLANKQEWKKWFPADLITESFPGQFKNWFYSLIAMSAVLENINPTKTVLGFATLLAEDGRPMHKSWGNAIEFNEGAEKIGVDVMRWIYCRQDPNKNLIFGYKNADLVKKQFHLILWNSYRFVVNNLIIEENLDLSKKCTYSILDRWIMSRVQNVNIKVKSHLKNYNTASAVSIIENLVQDYSTWYIRRSRSRVGHSNIDLNSKLSFYKTSFSFLTTLAKMLAPFNPFMAELIYTNISDEESVHLCDWPQENRQLINISLEKQMLIIRKAAEQFHSLRKSKNLKLRQPLRKATLICSKKINPEILDVLKDEINVKNIYCKLKEKGDIEIKLDTKLTKVLINEGKVREIIRGIQEQRKKMKTQPTEAIEVTLKDIPKGFEDEIKAKTYAIKISKGDNFQVKIHKKAKNA